MVDITGKALSKRYGKAAALKAPWLSTWRDAYKYTLPMRDVIDEPHPGQHKGLEVYDSTGVHNVSSFANRIQSDLFPPFTDFIQLEPGPSVPQENRKQAGQILEGITKEFHATIHHSNFDTAINEFILELGIGTGAMLANEADDDEVVRFEPCPAPLLSILPGPYGTVGEVFRKHKLAASLIREQWPDARLPSNVDADSKEDADKEICLIESTTPDYKRKAWYYQLTTEDGHETLLENPRVYQNYSPWIITRWAKAANEVWGRGPILYALPDIRTTNAVVEMVLKNASLAIAGVYLGVDDGVFNPNTARFVPGTIIPVARGGGASQGASLTPLERSGNFDVSQFILADQRANIERLLFNKALPPESGAVRSATEIVERMKMLQVDIGAAFGRLMSELIRPLVLRTLAIMNRKGIITFPFPVDGNMIKVTVTSPLAQSQKMQDLEKVVNWLQLLGMLGPEMIAYGAKVEAIPDYFADQLGVPHELRRTPGERQMMQQAAAKAAQAQQQAPQQAQQGMMMAAEGSGAMAA